MGYTVNEKLYTDDPLLDELVFNAKLMINGIILKDSDEADSFETEESLKLSDLYVAITGGNRRFTMFQYDEVILSELGVFTQEEITLYAFDNNQIPYDYREALTNLACDQFLENYVEYNNYYRMLNGLPDYGYPEYYVDESTIPEDKKKFFDFSIPLSQFKAYQITILDKLGLLSQIQNDNPTLKYLLHLGAKKIDIYKARTAQRFELLYLPDAEEIVSNRFKELLEKNRMIYTKRHYSNAYKFNSDYYDKFFIIMIIAESVANLIVEIPEWYIRRDVFDVRTIEFILESNGVKYFESIPLKYQVSLIRVLNKIIKYKSSSKNIYDLASIFDFDDIQVFKYYLVKNRKTDSKGDYVEANDSTLLSDMEKVYDLYFIKTPVDGVFDDYANDSLNKMSYDSITTEDKYWDGEDDHDYIKLKVMQKDFNIQPTKYMSMEVRYNMSEYQFQLEYFMNILMNNKIDKSLLNLKLPIVNTKATFEIVDIIVFIYICSFNYYNPSTKDYILNQPRDIYDEIPGPPTPEEDGVEMYDPNKVSDYDMDGMVVGDEYYDSDGGPAKTDDEYYIDNNAGMYVNSPVVDDENEIVDISKLDLDLNADGTMGYLEYADEDGGLSSSSTGNTPYQNAGEVVNAYVNPYRAKAEETDDDITAYFREDWIKTKIEEIDLSNRIFGFNLDADMDYLLSVVSKRHPAFGYSRGYTLEDLGVANFVTVKTGEIKNVTELMNIYNTNKTIYDNFLSNMLSCNNMEEYHVYRFTYEYLFTMVMDQTYFEKEEGVLYTTYKEFLEQKDMLLYNFFELITDEEDLAVRQYNMSSYLDNIINSIEVFLGTNSLKYVFNFVPSSSWYSTLNYLTLLVGFFKSYKASLLAVGATLIFDRVVDNNVSVYDKVPFKKIEMGKVDTSNTLAQFAGYNVSIIKPDFESPEEHVLIYPDYAKEYYDMNGHNSRVQQSYIDMDANTFKQINGNTIEDLPESEIDWDGGGTDDGEAMEIYGGDAFYDEDSVFIDFEGGKSSDVVNTLDPTYTTVYEWDGGDIADNIPEVAYLFDMEAGPAQNQVYYADYTLGPGESISEDEYMHSIYEMYETGSAYFYVYNNMDMETQIKISPTATYIEALPDGYYIDFVDLADPSQLTDLEALDSKNSSDVLARIAALEAQLPDLDIYDLTAMFELYMQEQHLDDTLDELQFKITEDVDPITGILGQSMDYTDSLIAWAPFN